VPSKGKVDNLFIEIELQHRLDAGPNAEEQDTDNRTARYGLKRDVVNVV
jgi:hypothetical protein